MDRHQRQHHRNQWRARRDHDLHDGREVQGNEAKLLHKLDDCVQVGHAGRVDRPRKVLTALSLPGQLAMKCEVILTSVR